MFLNYMGLVKDVLLLIFFAKIFGQRMVPILAEYGGDYIQYVLVGSIGWAYLWSSMGVSSRSLRMEMLYGTFEPIFMTPTSPFLVLIAYTIWGLFLGSLSVIVFLFLGFFVFDIVITGSFILALIIIVISIVIMVGFGMVVAGLNVFLKNVGPVVRVLQEAARFLCGVYFPLEVLPQFLRPVGKAIPVYYSIMGLRLALSDHASLSDVLYYIGILSVLAVAFMIFGMIFFRKALNKARKDGSLAYY